MLHKEKFPLQIVDQQQKSTFFLQHEWKGSYLTLSRQIGFKDLIFLLPRGFYNEIKVCKFSYWWLRWVKQIFLLWWIILNRIKLFKFIFYYLILIFVVKMPYNCCVVSIFKSKYLVRQKVSFKRNLFFQSQTWITLNFRLIIYSSFLS